MENDIAIGEKLRKNIRENFKALQSETEKYNAGDPDYSEERMTELNHTMTDLITEGLNRGYDYEKLHRIQHGWA